MHQDHFRAKFDNDYPGDQEPGMEDEIVADAKKCDIHIHTHIPSHQNAIPPVGVGDCAASDVSGEFLNDVYEEARGRYHDRSHIVQEMIKILQEDHQDRPVNLGCHQCADLLGCHPMVVWRIIRKLKRKGVITETKTGSWDKHRTSSFIYNYKIGE